MTQAIEILERHRLFLFEVEREADVQDAIKAITITVKQQAEELERLRDKNSALTQELDECGMLEKTLRELVKRHEAALEWAFDKSQGGLPIILRKIERKAEWIQFGIDKYTIYGLKNVSGWNDTPLSAIEAAIMEIRRK